MFSNLRQGSTLYILHKVGRPYIEVGTVDSISTFPVMGYYPGMPSMPIDLTVRVGDKVTPYRHLPATLETAEVIEETTGKQVTIICSKDAANTEVSSLRQASIDIINSVDSHRQRIEACDSLLTQLNPEDAEKAAQQAELKQLKEQMAELLEQNKMLLARVEGENTKKERSTR